MSISTFGEKDENCWVCGWFNVEGKLVDVQQYGKEIYAKKCAERITENNIQYEDGSWSEDSMFPFVGKLTMIL